MVPAMPHLIRGGGLLLFKANILRNRPNREALMESLIPTLGMEVDLFLSDEDMPLDDGLPN